MCAAYLNAISFDNGRFTTIIYFTHVMNLSIDQVQPLIRVYKRNSLVFFNTVPIRCFIVHRQWTNKTNENMDRNENQCIQSILRKKTFPKILFSFYHRYRSPPRTIVHIIICTTCLLRFLFLGTNVVRTRCKYLMLHSFRKTIRTTST